MWGVGGVCLCATPVGAISALSEPPNSSVQHNRSLPPAANGEQLSTWLERRRGGRRAPLLFLFPTPTTPTPIPPLVPAPLRKPPSSSSSSDSQASITHVQRRILVTSGGIRYPSWTKSYNFTINKKFKRWLLLVIQL